MSLRERVKANGSNKSVLISLKERVTAIFNVTFLLCSSSSMYYISFKPFPHVCMCV